MLLFAYGDKPQPQTPAASVPAPAMVVYKTTLAHGIDFKKTVIPPSLRKLLACRAWSLGVVGQMPMRVASCCGLRSRTNCQPLLN